ASAPWIYSLTLHDALPISTVLGASEPPPEVMRKDLYFRLAAFVIDAPPLRSRAEDILTLFTHFTVQFAEEYGCEPPRLNAGDARSEEHTSVLQSRANIVCR